MYTYIQIILLLFFVCLILLFGMSVKSLIIYIILTCIPFYFYK